MRSLLSIFSFRNRNPLAGIFLAIGLVVLIEASISRAQHNKLVASFQSPRYSGMQGKADVLIMGDSVVTGGLKADGLNKALPPGTTIANYGMPGSGPEFPYFFLKRLIAHGNAPKAIIYAPSPHTFQSQRVPLLVSSYCQWPEIGEVALSGIHTCDVVYGVLCKLSPTLRYREELAAFIKGDPNDALTRLGDQFRQHTLSPHGFPPFSCDPVNLHFCTKFLQLAREKGIKVYWIIMPTPAMIDGFRRSVHYQPDYYAFMDKISTDCGATLFQREFIVYDDDFFKDFAHLTDKGADRFTAEFAQKLKQLEPQIFADVRR